MTDYSQIKMDTKKKLLDLLALHAYKNGEFTLSSGKKSPHYVNCKPVTLSGVGLSLVSELFLELLDSKSVAVSGLTLGGDPLVSGLAMESYRQGGYVNALIVRKNSKGYGTNAWIEGPLPPLNSEVTILEDVVTTGASSLKAVEKIRDAGYVVNNVLTVIDREEGAESIFEQHNINLISLFTLKEIFKRHKEIQ